MTFQLFTEYLERLYATFGKSANAKQVMEYYDSLKNCDAVTFHKAFNILKRDGLKFPTISEFLRAIEANRPKVAEGGHWNGSDCVREDCNKGLIFYKRYIKKAETFYSFVGKCPACKSYNAPFIPFYDTRMDEKQHFGEN